MSTLRQFASRVFGNISWEPPLWLRAHRRAVVGLALAAVLAAGAGMGGYVWYQKQPKPRTVAVRVDSIPVTKLEKVLHPSPLTLHFDSAAARIDLAGKPVATGIRIEPAIDGKWRWNGDSALSFRPN